MKLALAFAGVLALVYSDTLAQAATRPVKLCDLCAGYTVSKRGNDVLIRCPGMAQPWMIVSPCLNPKVVRSGVNNSNVTITCNA